MRGVFFATAVISSFAFGASIDVLDYADPFIGTQGTGHTTPAAAYPFGMVQPGPDTGTAGWEHCSGYQYGDKRIQRFSQTHLSGTGCADFCDVGFMPFAGDVKAAEKENFFFGFDKKLEKATPGYYSATLDGGVKVEVTCTEHVALYRFTYAKTPARLLFDPTWAIGRVVDADISSMRDNRVTGHVNRKGWPDRDYYFAFELSRDPKEVYTIASDDGKRPCRQVYTFQMKDGDELYLKVSLSRSSAAGAVGNIRMEIPGWDFDGVLSANRTRWRQLLSRLEAEGTETQLKALYTSMYHLCFQPNRLSDAGSAPIYSTFSCWDTYRAAGPLYTLVAPEYVPHFVNSFLWHFDHNGFLPIWTLWGRDNQCMLGVHSVPMIVDAYLKGFKGVDWNRAYECVRRTLTENHPVRGKEGYDLLAKYGYFPFDIIKGESVARLLEACYDDACAARFARKMGKADDAKFFEDRSLLWTNCFDRATGFMRGKDSQGNWREPFNPFALGHDQGRANDFTEGNSWQWTWHVMQDPDRLIELMGGKAKFEEKLCALFRQPKEVEGMGKVLDATGLIGQYAHGNEPSHHVIYFFSRLGRMDLVEKYVKEVMETQYGVTPDGLCGNDDCGQMSAWYIFAALGRYPFDPCGGEYVKGWSPFKRCVIRDFNRDPAFEENPLPDWAFGPFVRPEGVNPVISPNKESVFDDPMSKAPLKWEESDTFNPASAVMNGRLYVLYRAEDNTHQGVGSRTSRLGFAETVDGVHMKRDPRPVLYPCEDDQKEFDWDGGCEDPRIAMTEDGLYVCTYTSWNHKVPRLCVATSRDLRHWKKHGPAFAKYDGGKWRDKGCKSAAIVQGPSADDPSRYVIRKFDGKYLMYWGEGSLDLAQSDNLVDWEPVGNVIRPRRGYFDSALTEMGPAAIVTPKGIVVMYNGKNSNWSDSADVRYPLGTYCGGQILCDLKDPRKVLARLDVPYFRPKADFERKGQYRDGTVFTEGLSFFKGKWHLYYGCADSFVGLAVWDPSSSNRMADEIPVRK